MQLGNYVDISNGAFQALQGLCNTIKFVFLQMRENKISLRKWSRGTAHLPTLDGTLQISKSKIEMSLQNQA